MKKIYLIGILYTISYIAHAQSGRNEFSVGVSGGVSTFHHTVTEGKYKIGVGGSINLGYLLKLATSWSIGTGVDVTLYQSKTAFDQYTDNYSILSNSIPGGTPEQNMFDFRFSYTQLHEHQKAFYLNIPVFVQFQGKHLSGFYAKAGFKIGIPLAASRKSSYSSLKTSGYFAYENIEYTDLPEHGFGSYPGKTHNSDIETALSISPFAEIGWKWQVGTHYYIYTGIYGEYGVRKIYTPGSAAPLLEYHENGTITGNPVWESARYSGEKTGMIVSSPIRPMAAGITIRWAFSL